MSLPLTLAVLPGMIKGLDKHNRVCKNSSDGYNLPFHDFFEISKLELVDHSHKRSSYSVVHVCVVLICLVPCKSLGNNSWAYWNSQIPKVESMHYYDKLSSSENLVKVNFWVSQRISHFGVIGKHFLSNENNLIRLRAKFKSHKMGQTQK